MRPDLLKLKILLPFRVFADCTDVSSLCAETATGSFGILPHRLDCAAALVPGVLTYVTTDGGEKYVAINEGVLIKTGLSIVLSVRNAIAGTDLAELRKTVEREFIQVRDRDQNERASIKKLESRLMKQLTELKHE